MAKDDCKKNKEWTPFILEIEAKVDRSGPFYATRKTAYPMLVEGAVANGDMMKRLTAVAGKSGIVVEADRYQELRLAGYGSRVVVLRAWLADEALAAELAGKKTSEAGLGSMIEKHSRQAASEVALGMRAKHGVGIAGDVGFGSSRLDVDAASEAMGMLREQVQAEEQAEEIASAVRAGAARARAPRI